MNSRTSDKKIGGRLLAILCDTLVFLSATLLALDEGFTLLPISMFILVGINAFCYYLRDYKRKDIDRYMKVEAVSTALTITLAFPVMLTSGVWFTLIGILLLVSGLLGIFVLFVFYTLKANKGKNPEAMFAYNDMVSKLRN